MDDAIRCGPKIQAMPLLMQVAFRDMVMWAISDPGIRSRYMAETGNVLPSQSGSPIIRLIDEATGVTESFAAPFIDWCWDGLWGDWQEGDA